MSILDSPLPAQLPAPHLCECGCGQPTLIANNTDRKRGTVKGQPTRYRSGHYPRPPLTPRNPSGICQCGCGLPAPIAQRSNRSRGEVRGYPNRFIDGHQRRAPWEPRFWANVDQSGGPGACWPWQGTLSYRGYGRFYSNHREVLAHRLMYELAFGPPPPITGACVLHTCDTPACVNPAHLAWGTKADNNADCRAKDRHARGERQAAVKLTDAAVRTIRQRAANGEELQALADGFHVSKSTVHNVVSGRSWRHVR